MWPFTKKPAAPPPDDVVIGNNRAHYDAQVDQWEFVVDGVEFTYSPLTFPPEAFQWAHAEVVHIKRLWHEIDRRVEAYLRDGGGMNAAARELLGVSLDDYEAEGDVMLSFTGDDSWGDFGVTVTLTDGKIVEVSGGD